MISERIYPKYIITDHFATLKSGREGQRTWESKELITFIAIPIIVAIAVVVFKVDFSKSTGNIMIVLSIFTGLLLNVNALIFSMLKNDVKEYGDGRDKLRGIVLKESFSNVSFEILLSIFTILLCLCLSFAKGFALSIMNGLIAGCLLMFVLTLFMVVGRWYILFTKEIDLIK